MAPSWAEPAASVRSLLAGAKTKGLSRSNLLEWGEPTQIPIKTHDELRQEKWELTWESFPDGGRRGALMKPPSAAGRELVRRPARATLSVGWLDRLVTRERES